MHFCAFLVMGIMRIISVKLFRIWTSGLGKMLINDISYLELWQPLGSADGNHVCNFSRRHHEVHFS